MIPDLEYLAKGVIIMINKWVGEEMAELATGDKRVDKRTKNVLQAIMDKPSMAFTQQFESGGELKACYRLFDSDLVSPEVILEPHFKQSLERIKLCKVAVIASDTTSLNYTTRLSNQDSGYISSNNAQGFFMHTSLATTLDRQPLGVVGAKFWSRSKEKPEKKVHRDYLPIEEKESYKWINSYVIANEIARHCPDTQIINVADREADIIELWEEAIKANKEKNAAHLVVRCNHDRAVAPTKENSNTKLFEFGREAPVVGYSEFELRDRKTHKVLRNVKQEVRASSVCISPAYRSGVKKREVVLNLVLMQELDPPEGATSVSWYLLTTLPIESNEDIQKIIQAYLARWDIETLFRTFKTGCKVEERSLRTADRLYPMFALFLIVAWRINSLSRISRANPDLPCTVVFSEMEWRATYTAVNKSLQPISKVPTIREMLIMIARLGGYLNRKNDPEPGAKVIWRGLEYLRGFIDAWEILQSSTTAENVFSVKKSYG
jgi:hypothetical protein